MFGGLHIEIAMFRTIGDWLEGSGWTTAIHSAGIATAGVADSLTKVSHLTRTRHAHQVTSAALFELRHQMYETYKASMPDSEETLDFTSWSEKMAVDQPQFLYWSSVLEMELCILKLVRAIREANYEEYIQTLVQLMPWLFSLDHINYSSWLSVHIRDLCSLPERHPEWTMSLSLESLWLGSPIGYSLQ